MQVDITGNGADLRAEACNLVCEHAWSGDLNGVVPIVVVVTEGVGEVKDG